MLIDRRHDVDATFGSGAVSCADFPAAAQVGPEGPRWELYDVQVWAARQMKTAAVVNAGTANDLIESLMDETRPQVRPEDGDEEAETRPGE